MENITVIGGGVLGSQIAFQTSYSGKKCTVYVMDEKSKNELITKLDALKDTYIQAIKDMDLKKEWCRGISDYDTFDKDKCIENVKNGYDNIVIETSLDKAVSKADLVIESITEDLNIKRNFYEKLAKVLPAKTIVVTNSSTLLPSKLCKYTGRENMFLSLHFANSIWKNNVVEVMKHSKTDDKYFKEVMKFGKEINMISLPVEKEKSGYLLNSMLIPFLFSSLDLLVNGISDVESIDKAWKYGTGAPEGPFEILDKIGLVTAYNIVDMYVKIPSFLAPYNFKGISKMLKVYLDEGKTGKSSGEGFYKYK